MSEKLYRVMSNDVKQWYCIENVEGGMFSMQEIVDKLNEQQATIDKLEWKLELKTEEVEYLKRMMVKWGMVKDE